MNFDKGCQTPSFLSNRGCKNLQFSLTMEFLSLNNLQIVKAVSIEWENRYCVQSLEAMMYGGRNGFKQVEKAVVRYLD